jgi:hypothetical protein
MIDNFKKDLYRLESNQLFRKYILSGQSFALDDTRLYQLKEEVCGHFEIEFNEIVLVGSGKLGFSIKPNKRYSNFGDESDIDIAVVSTELFHKVWKEAFLYKKSGAYWPKAITFFQYLSEGWIRPDKLPSSRFFRFSGKWWDFFNMITSSGQYGPLKIRGGIYHSWFFLQEYQKICIQQCIDEIR